MQEYYIGIDAGTASVRAGIVDSMGRVVMTSTKSINVFRPLPDYYEQSSDEIWQAVCCIVKEILQESGVSAAAVHGVGIDATSSQVVLDKNGDPLSISPIGDKSHNIIMWLDHRANKQAEQANATGHERLKFIGDRLSPEHDMPKIMWIKQNLPDQWNKVAHFMGLCDFLAWKATGCLDRSLNSVVSKWSYDSKAIDNHSWNDDFLKIIGLEDLTENKHAKLGSRVIPTGDPCGQGLTNVAANELGLLPGTAVSACIDAYCGAIGIIGCRADIPSVAWDIPLSGRLSMICGSSTCHLALNEKCLLVPGVFGPFFGSTLAGYWVHEGGQSASGILCDHIVESHKAYEEINKVAKSRGETIYTALNNLLREMVKNSEAQTLSQLTKDLHIYPDFHANRAPLNDPTLKGMMCGLSLASTPEDLAIVYLSTIQALAYETKFIIDELEKKGHKFEVIHLCGGIRKNEIYVQLHADVCGLPIILPDESETMLIGGAILGAKASGKFATLEESALHMGGKGQVIMPVAEDQQYHQKKYAVFLKMLEHQMEYRKMMK